MFMCQSERKKKVEPLKTVNHYIVHLQFIYYTSNILQFKKSHSRTSLLVQSLKICLQMQGTRVPSLVGEEATCQGAAKPTDHGYAVPRTQRPWSTTREAPMMRSPHTATRELPLLAVTRESLGAAAKTQGGQQLMN